MNHDQEIAQILTKKGIFKKEDTLDHLDKAKKLNKPLSEYLIKKNLISEEEWLIAEAEVLDLSYMNLERINIDEKILKEFSEETVRQYRFVPFAREGNILKVGLINPEDHEALEVLRFIGTRRNIKIENYLISKASFDTVLRQYQNIKGRVEEALKELEIQTAAEKIPTRRRVVTAEPLAAEAPISKIVGVIIRYGVETKASDIHIEALENSVKIRFRVDGVLHTSLYLEKEVHQSIITRIKILCRLKIDETRIPQDGRFHVKLDDKKIDFRVSTLPTANGEKVVLRILDPTVGIYSLDGLGLVGRNLRVVEKAMNSPYGMILSSGPTGSGKTTTLYTILNILNQEGVNIISLEDPIEYFIEGVNQSQVKPDIGYTFSSGLRHILRQDPNIIMVGEIRDPETAELATHAALTGHLLLSTVHTKDAVGIVPRLTDMGVQKYLLPSTLSLGVAQRLGRRLCQDCREEYEPSEEIQEIIKRTLLEIPKSEKEGINEKGPYKLFRAPGCKYCQNKGSKGRIGIFEIIEMTPQLEDIIVTDAADSKFRDEAKRQGMTTMFQDAILKTLRGQISFEEVLRITKE
ncbi:MAG: GspE/PulE family protein [Candidatus Paceibacterota bacterium]|jgi:type IV pilus assembly protein PilB